MNRVLVTGAGGFVGRALCLALAKNRSVHASLRNSCAAADFPANVTVFDCDVSETMDWSAALEQVSSVVHCAARVHMMRETANDSLRKFREVNVVGTMNLARQAAERGVQRFVFLSSIGVNGVETCGRAFSPSDAVAPHSPYAISKYEAELELLALAKQSGMEVVVIRPPLIYGPNAPGNFASLLKWLSSGIPLPLRLVSKNRRSFVFIDNLLDFICMCLDHPSASNQIFLVSDGEDLSTAALLQRLGGALGQQAWLMPVPVGLLKLGFNLLGCSQNAQRLCGSLQVDITKAREMLGWSPPVSVNEGLRRTAVHWLNIQGSSRS